MYLRNFFFKLFWLLYNLIWVLSQVVLFFSYFYFSLHMCVRTVHYGSHLQVYPCTQLGGVLIVMALVLRVMTVKAGLQRCMNVNLAPGWKGVILCLLVSCKCFTFCSQSRKKLIQIKMLSVLQYLQRFFFFFFYILEFFILLSQFFLFYLISTIFFLKENRGIILSHISKGVLRMF